MTIEDIANLQFGDKFDPWISLRALALEVIRLREEVERLKNPTIFYEAGSKLTGEDLKP